MIILTSSFSLKIRLTKPTFLQGNHHLELSSNILFSWDISVPVCHSPHHSLMFPPGLLHSLHICLASWTFEFVIHACGSLG